ncbi:MAG: hypothetical protein GY787_26620, partial [Alteromonadales bacterium]|nr:hypothetical protein [Alteromonadales bacterium]
MFTSRRTPIALAIISLFSTQAIATENNQDEERMNLLINKGYSSPSATTQNYSGDTVIKIVPTSADNNKP